MDHCAVHEVYCMMIQVVQSQPNKKNFEMIALTGMLIVSIFFPIL